jgi:hypothetical protein
MPTNVAISQDTTNPFSESDICINFNNLLQIIAGSNANNSTTQAQYWSIDGGVSWNQTSLPAVPGDSFQSDPAVGWTSDGTAWALTQGVTVTPVPGNPNNPKVTIVTRCFKSTTNGQTWANESVVSGSQTGTDKALLWVDRSSTSPYSDNMYAVWHLGGLCYINVRPGPSGSWGTPLQVSGSETTGSADGGDIKTNAFGDVFAFWPDSGSQTLRVVKSINGGASFGSPVNIATTSGSFTVKIPAQNSRTAFGGGTLGTLIYITGGAYRTATEDLVFACWSDLDGSSTCNAESDQPGSSATSTCKTRILFARSIDGGAHWQNPVKLNDQSGLNDQFFPRFMVDDTTGTMMVVYYDTVGDPLRVNTNLWMQTSSDGGVTWTAAEQITTKTTDEATGAEDGGQEYGDYIGLTGYDGNFYACWTDRRGGAEEQIYGAAITTTDIQFYGEKTTYGKDEVSAQPVWPPAFWIAVDGFNNAELGLTKSNLGAPPSSPQPTITATIAAANNPTLTAAQIASIAANLPTVNTLGPLPLVPQDSTLVAEPERFLYPYTIAFNGTAAFSTLLPHQFAYVTLNATFTLGQITRTASCNIELVAGEDPYFTDIDPKTPKQAPWLSYDVRFFTVTGGNSRFGVTPAMSNHAKDAPAFIQNVIKQLNAPGANLNGDSFEGLTQDEDQSALEFLQKDNNGNFAFNFALARVRLIGKTPGAQAVGVRVFFRMFQAQTTVSNFSEVGTGAGTYRWGTNGASGDKIALLGVQDNEYVTIPCFASPRVNFAGATNSYVSKNMDQQTDLPNVATINVNPGKEVDTYFGCWLDVNQPQQLFLPGSDAPNNNWDGPWTGTLQSINQVITRAPHQCLVAEIRFDDTPIPPNATTEDNDKLAQRNIAWLGSASPVAHPFEVRCSPQSVQIPDELMIFWGETPLGSTASFYLPGVTSSAILALADSMYQAHLLTASDAHTIECPVGGVTFIPIPKGTARLAGLLTVDLPSGMHKGKTFDIVVRQVSEMSATIAPPPPPPQQPKIAIRAAAEVLQPQQKITWRQVLAAFQVTVTIQDQHNLLYPEERLLAWLRWIEQSIPHANRWYPIFQRYIKFVTGRVIIFGGHPIKIQPSAYGNVPGHFGGEPGHGEPGGGGHGGPSGGRPGHSGPVGHGGGEPGHGVEFHAHCHEFTGKVEGIIYDRFGDFDGFLLRTEHGHEIHFRGREHKVEQLIQRAYLERIRIRVFVNEHGPHWPAEIILLHF